jgi:MFS transporter, DHA2 family, multidrug resistance protein
MTGPDANTQDTRPAVTTHPLPGIAVDCATEVLGLQVRQQAHTLAISDSFLLRAKYCVVCLVVVSFMSKVPPRYRRITAAPVEAKSQAHSMKGDRV